MGVGEPQAVGWQRRQGRGPRKEVPSHPGVDPVLVQRPDPAQAHQRGRGQGTLLRPSLGLGAVPGPGAQRWLGPGSSRRPDGQGGTADPQ